MGKIKNISLRFIIGLVDPFIFVPNQVGKRVQQEETKIIQKMALGHYIAWPSIFILLYFLFDQNKDQLDVWRLYRFGVAGFVLVMGMFAFLFRKNKNLIKLTLFISGIAMSIAVAWSITQLKDRPPQSIWIPVIPAFIFLTISRSFIFPTLILVATVVLTKPYWSVKFRDTFLMADTIFSLLMISFGHITKKIWIQSKINKFLHDDAVQESIERQIEFDNEIKRFISPVLVKRIEEKTTNGKTLVMALDDVLMRKEAPVAVMFTDMRDFSTRSLDIDFVEQELVPSSSKIIDSAEDNMGVAKQIGDAVFVYYSMEDPEEGLLRAIKDSVKGCLDEKQRIKTLGRKEPERFFSVAYGFALVGNMASFRHREATVIGSPANLSARMDALTKEYAFKTLICDGNKVIVSKAAKEILKTFNDKLEFNEVSLEDIQLIMKSFPDEKYIYLLATTAENVDALNDVLIENNLAPIEC